MSDTTRILIFVCCISVVLSACTLRSVTPGRDYTASKRQPLTSIYTVTAGDTLYSIAWDTGRDYRSLASWNNISPPYLIKPGQRLRLSPLATRSAKKTYTVARGDSLYSIASEAGVNFHDLASWNNISPPYLIKPGQRLRLRPPDRSTGYNKGNYRKRSTISKRQTAGKRSSTKRTGRPQKIATWSWPAQGKIIGRFSPNGNNKGVDIGGNKGQAVVSAAPGRVVYKGSGLRGYGQLIIVKHNEDFLSAYAHCDKIYVNEGDVIKRGQKIAGMGNSGTDRVKLHFEIRYRGNPVDPTRYLPKL